MRATRERRANGSGGTLGERSGRVAGALAGGWAVSDPGEPIDAPDPEDRWNLERFVVAQAPLWDDVVAELRAGCKRTHWMWFVFPQLAGLGRSATARRYALSGAEEARAYLAHPLLGPRLHEATALVTAHEAAPRTILGAPDDLKFRSSMTLFAQVADDPEPFRRALETHADGEPDPLTLERLETNERD